MRLPDPPAWLPEPPARHADAFEEMRGYLVNGPEGEIGILDEWLRDEDGRPTTLIVAQGWWGRRRFQVPVADLIRVDHRRELMYLAPGAPPPYRSLLQRLIRIGSRPLESRYANPAIGRRDPVICDVSDSEHRLAVAAVAGGLARRLDAPLLLCHAGSPDQHAAHASDGQGPSEGLNNREADHFVDVLLSRVADGAEIGRAAGREAARTLAQIAVDEGALLLVVGCEDARPQSSPLLDSAACGAAATQAPCPVVVVPIDMSPWALSDPTPVAASLFGWSYGMPSTPANRKE